MAIDKDILDRLLKDYKSPEDLLGPGGLLKQLTGALVERALETEMTDHLGYEKHEPKGRGSGNSRNGSRSKTVFTEIGPVEIEVPRDTNSTFDPVIVNPSPSASARTCTPRGP